MVTPTIFTYFNNLYNSSMMTIDISIIGNYYPMFFAILFSVLPMLLFHFKFSSSSIPKNA